MTQSGCLFSLQESIRNAEYSVDDVGVPGIRHFMYKSKVNIQYTQSLFGEPYNRSSEEQTRIYLLYQQARAQMQQRSRPLKLLYTASQSETIFAWISNSFELYVTFGPLITKHNATNAVNALLRWIKKEEESLFILNAPTFQ